MAGGVTAIVLAAGESRRMEALKPGSLKPLLPYGSGTVIQAVVRSLKASPVDQVLVVLGHRSDEIAAVLDGEGIGIVINPRYLAGMLSSIQAGVAAAAKDAEWLVIALGDQPSLQAETVVHLLREAQAGLGQGKSIVVPSFRGRRGHPLFIHCRHRSEIGSLSQEVGLRELMLRHPDAIEHVVMEDEHILQDMDTPQDYDRELARLRESLIRGKKT